MTAEEELQLIKDSIDKLIKHHLDSLDDYHHFYSLGSIDTLELLKNMILRKNYKATLKRLSKCK